MRTSRLSGLSQCRREAARWFNEGSLSQTEKRPAQRRCFGRALPGKLFRAMGGAVVDRRTSMIMISAPGL